MLIIYTEEVIVMMIIIGLALDHDLIAGNGNGVTGTDVVAEIDTEKGIGITGTEIAHAIMIVATAVVGVAAGAAATVAVIVEKGTTAEIDTEGYFCEQDACLC